MRILVVQESDWLEKGPHQSHHLMERLSERDHEIRIIDHEILWRSHKVDKILDGRKVFSDVHKVVEHGGVTVIRPRIVKLPMVDYLSLVQSHRAEISRQFREFRPDIVVGFGILNAWLAERHAKANHIPFVYYVIDELHRLVPQKAFRRIARTIEKINMKNASLTISINEKLRDYTVMMGAAEDRTKVIGAGVDLDGIGNNNFRTEMRNELRLRESDIVMFFMGWLYDFSGLDRIATQLTRDSKRYSNIKLLIMGRGELWETLREISTNRPNGDRIKLVDWQPYGMVPRYLSASDICILPAESNDVMRNIVPIKIYEYMAAGKPVVSTRLPGILREFGEGNGVTYADSPSDVLCRVEELARGGSVLTEGMRARNHVEKHDWGRITNEFESTLRHLVKTRSPGNEGARS